MTRRVLNTSPSNQVLHSSVLAAAAAAVLVAAALTDRSGQSNLGFTPPSIPGDWGEGDLGVGLLTGRSSRKYEV